MSAPSLPNEPTPTFPYRLDRKAGEGAMGVVYRAIDVNLERPVAIKVLRTEVIDPKDEEPRKRFLQEARAAAALTHPAVATVHQVGEVEGAPFLVMEWISGTDLEEALKLDGQFPLERAVPIARELLDVLAAAHRERVFHRDIKPSNLMLLSGDRLKVTDFGIARLQGRELVKTMAGSVLATPRYASPEQLEGREVDGRSDLFSAAVVFYEMLTGATPWGGATLSAMIGNLLSKDAQPIRELQPSLPPALGTWFDRALLKNRDDRFQRAAEMIAALDRAVQSSTGSARTAAMAPTTRTMASPGTLHVADAGDERSAILSYARTWEERNLGVLDREVFLDKLLDRPLHAEPFAGLALFGSRVLLVEGGVILVALDVESGRRDEEGVLEKRAQVRLYSRPPSLGPGTMGLLATALLPRGAARSEGLDSEMVNLSAFAAKLLDQGFEGILRLDGRRGSGLVLLAGGQAPLALFTRDIEGDPERVGWQDWLSSTAVTASFYDRRTDPPRSWFRRGFQDVEMEVVSESGEALKDRTLTGTLSLENPRGTRLLRAQLIEPDRGQVGAVPLSRAPMARFAQWLLDELPAVLVERRKAEGWKYLGDWVLQVRRMRLHGTLERPGTSTRDAFDLVTEDAEGKVMHLGHRLASVDAGALEELVDRVVAAKEARTARGDIGGVLVVSPHFDESVKEAYEALLNRGFGNRFFGLDRSMGYEGFVRLGARRGFHLLLVKETINGFEPIFSF